MARKNTLFEVDIAKENPLITIIKYGKIPVVQVTDYAPFRNKKVEYWYKQEDWTAEETKQYNNLIVEHKKKGLHNVTYCNIGGYHGTNFSGCDHVPLNINVGYIEPDELVYDETSKTYITAKRKLESIKKHGFHR